MNTKKPKFKITEIFKGDVEGGHIIRIKDPCKDMVKGFDAAQSKEFFSMQGQKIGLALVEVLPIQTVVYLASFLYGVLERTLNQGEEVNEDNQTEG